MSWQKFTDRARENRKIRRSSPEAITLWWAVGNWCCEHKTDGFIDKDDLADAWRPLGRKFDHEKAAKECVQRGLFVDHGTAYEVHDFLEYNPSKEQEDDRKAKDARRAASYRARKAALKNLGQDRSITALVTRDEMRDEVRDGTRDSTSDEARDAGRDSHVTSRERHADDAAGDPSGVRHALPLRPASTRFEDQGEWRAGARPPSSSSHAQTFRDVFAAEAFGMGWKPTPRLTHTHLAQAVDRAREMEGDGDSFEEAARKLSRTALEGARATGKDVGFVLLACEPGKPFRAPANGVRATAGVTPSADDDDPRNPTIPLHTITSWK